jgi:hypothetical protein
MTKIYDVNRVATYGGATAMFYLKQTLKNAGWVVSASSDGLTYYPTSDGITTDNSGSGGMNNSNAWFWIMDPANKRGFSAQRGSGSNTSEHGKHWRIDWNEFGRSIVDSGSLTRTTLFASLSLGYAPHGSGSNAAPSTMPLYTTPGTFRAHTVAYNNPYNGVYGFYHFCSELGTGTGKISTVFTVDPILSGSTPSAIDTAPYVIKTIFNDKATNWLNTASTVFFTGLSMTLNAPYLNTVGNPWWGQTVSGMPRSGSVSNFNFVTTFPMFNGMDVNASTLGVGYSFPGRMFEMGSSMFEGAGFDILLPIMWVGGQISAKDYITKYRGYAGRLRIHSNSPFDGVGGRKYPDTTNLATDAYICVGGGLAMPWPENVVAIA